MKNSEWPPPETMLPLLEEYRQAREEVRREEALRAEAMAKAAQTDWMRRDALMRFHARHLEMRAAEGRLLRAKDAIFAVLDAMIDGPEQMKGAPAEQMTGPPIAEMTGLAAPEMKGAAARPPQMTGPAAPGMTNAPTAKETVRKAMLENPLDIDGDEDDPWVDGLGAETEDGEDEP